MGRYRLWLAAALSFVVLEGCASVPLTGRRQMNLIPSSQMSAMGAGNYRQVMESSKLSGDRDKVEMIRRVGGKISAAAEKFLKENGRSEDLKYYSWEYNLIDDDETVNAWAMPGGKIAFYTGILKLATTEDEIAVIMGHEVGHVIANHGNERMSQMMLVQFGSIALNKMLEAKPEETKNIFLTAFGMSAQIGVLLPYSRKHEYEADWIGLKLMHDAEYDPYAAVEFWNKMIKLSSGSPPEFLSTHPSSSNRVEKMKQNIRKLQ
ncbi:MAG: M48 family metallopeptidase [Elusimicrobia bacterium]|nr:M48 family metallopeptidase [Elusimicrobiota bacterium]